MADIFIKAEAAQLFKQKRILLLGDSNMRALYKDLLQLITCNALISEKTLKAKLPKSVRGDTLVKSSRLTNERVFQEERVYDNDPHYFHYVFITCCYGDAVEEILKRLPDEICPDVVIMNSCLWDITRWGPDGVDKYKKNLHILIQRFKELLSPTALVIWTTTLPVAQEMKGGFLIPQVEFMKYQLRYEVMEANFYTWQLFTENGFDVIDFHYHLQMQLTRRADDGVHWMPPALRHMTNLVLTHIALAWRVPLPGRFRGIALERKVNGALMPDINPPPLPPISIKDSASKLPSQTTDRSRTRSAERNGRSDNQPERSRSRRRRGKNCYNSYNHWQKRRIVNATRRLTPAKPYVQLNTQHPNISQIRRVLRDHNRW